MTALYNLAAWTSELSTALALFPFGVGFLPNAYAVEWCPNTYGMPAEPFFLYTHVEAGLVEFWASADEYWDAVGGDPPRPH